MKVTKKISLIIPAYNEEKYLKDCLDCIAQQQHFIDEVIVVDNNSFDRTSHIAHSYSFVKVVVEKQRGVTHARQKGYLEAQGNIIAFIDADTRMPIEWVTKVIQEFEKNHDVVCVSGPIEYYDQPYFFRLITKYIFWYCFGYPVYRMVGYMAIGGNLAVRKQTLDAMGGWDTKINFYGDDTDFSRRACQFGKVKFIINFSMPTSSRRLKGQGIFKTTYLYVKNYVSQVFINRPVTHDSVDIR